MTTRIEAAVDDFRKGFSCSQAVLAAFGPDFGLDRETALKISQVFGGGLARSAGTCGAAAGALLVISLKHGRTRPEDTAARETTYALTREFLQIFRERHGKLDCRDLLGCDISTAEGSQKAAELKLHDTLCPEFIRTAVEILEELLDQPPAQPEA